jgi:antitoxin ParD1/3/4
MDMPTRNINLTGRYDEFVTGLVASGQFKNVSEVMRAGLHLLEQQSREEEEKIALLRSLATEGFDDLDQGRGTVIEGESQLRKPIAGIGRRAAKIVKATKAR